jgi:two-component system, cell cycle sensor histidine kinase and response regulator CckA
MSESVGGRGDAVAAIAGGLAHDLNNLLSAVVMLVDTMSGSGATPREQELLDAVGESARRGGGLLRQLGWLCRGAPAEEALFQPRHLLLDLERVLRALLPPGITLVNRFAPDLWLLTGDPVRIYEGFLDLCLAAPTGTGVLVLAAWNERLDELTSLLHAGLLVGSHIVLEVSGVGTASLPARAAALFASAGGVAETTAQVGGGQAFRIYLPARGGDDEMPATTARAKGAGELILIVEDDAALRQTIAAVLQTHGYRTATASDGAEAVARFAREDDTIAAVILGARLRFLDGPGVVRALRHLRPTVPVLAMGTDPELDGWPEDKGGATAVLVKPFGVPNLLAAVARALGRQGL